MKLEKLSLTKVCELYKEKQQICKAGDFVKLAELKRKYPEIFTMEFKAFVANMKDCIKDVYHRLGRNFYPLLDE